ncbi:MAG: hypothetical protein JJE50_06160 [Actinomycetales bacterium]|nr:hypothetical protein [Actinomycetales bacterium]
MSTNIPEEGVAPRGHEVELLEFDETIPPRPEEEIADAGRWAKDAPDTRLAPDDAELSEG